MVRMIGAVAAGLVVPFVLAAWFLVGRTPEPVPPAALPALARESTNPDSDLSATPEPAVDAEWT
ncbi:MAG: hypothetical protein HUU46_03600 [Candidatus Hydrogenedentes bacterium]|nr:hypothetical protein [Candidatus Hydrogenedentota bacterium]